VCIILSYRGKSKMSHGKPTTRQLNKRFWDNTVNQIKKEGYTLRYHGKDDAEAEKVKCKAHESNAETVYQSKPNGESWVWVKRK
jgi:hypothetical protein